MPFFAQSVLRNLHGSPAPRSVLEDLAAAADCLAKAHIGNFTTDGLHPALDQEGITPREAQDIEAALLAIYHAHPDAPGVAAVLWALSKARNLALRPLFLAHVERAMQRLQLAYGELSQAICGLDDLIFCGADVGGHPELPPNGVGGVLADTLNHADAYLRREGILIPYGGRAV